MFDDSHLEQKDGPSIADSIEWFVDRSFSVLARLVMPWKWFGDNPSEGLRRAESRKRHIVSEQMRWRYAVASEALSSKFFQCLEGLEILAALAIRKVLYPKRRYDRHPDSDEPRHE